SAKRVQTSGAAKVSEPASLSTPGFHSLLAGGNRCGNASSITETRSACEAPGWTSILPDSMMPSSSSMLSPIEPMRILRAKITSFDVAALWSWPSATEPRPSVAAANKAAPIAPAIDRRAPSTNRVIVVSFSRMREDETSWIGAANLPRRWVRLRTFTRLGVPEDEHRHRLELLRLELVVKCRHHAAPPFDDGFADRGAI